MIGGSDDSRPVEGRLEQFRHCRLQLPRHVDVALGRLIVLMLHQRLERVAAHSIRIHRRERPPKVVEAIELLSVRLHPGGLLDEFEFRVERSPVDLQRENADVKRAHGLQVIEG